MEWVTSYTHPKDWKFIIEEEPLEDLTNQTDLSEYSLNVWDEHGNNTHDFYQDSLEEIINQAFEDFGIPINSWKPVEGTS